MKNHMEVAEMIGREHSELLKTIRRFISHMEKIAEGKNSSGSKSNNHIANYFTESTYDDVNGQKRPCYDVTKRGCELIAHKMTGIKGTEFTIKYIDRFHDMENVINDNRMQLPQTIQGQIQLLAQGNVELNERVNKVEDDIKSIKEDLPLLPIEADEISKAAKKNGVEVMGGKDAPAYHNRSIVTRVYTDIYGNVKRNFQVSSYKGIRRKDVQRAISVVEAYVLPVFLADEITMENNQQTMNV